jgi:hypothetical protein
MKTYNSKYGIITKRYLVLFSFNCRTISLNDIHQIKIDKKKPAQNKFINYIKQNNYDFTIMLVNKKEIKFSFSKRNLNKTRAFKNQILHNKYSFQDSILEK